MRREAQVEGGDLDRQQRYKHDEECSERMGILLVGSRDRRDRPRDAEQERHDAGADHDLIEMPRGRCPHAVR